MAGGDDVSGAAVVTGRDRWLRGRRAGREIRLGGEEGPVAGGDGSGR
ncbi:hypothetical protein [Streptomyces sp. NPDC048392]